MLTTPGETRWARSAKVGGAPVGGTAGVCSASSLDRPGVRIEISKLLSREERAGVANLLIPVDLDGYVREWDPTDRPGLGTTLRDRVIADFRGWEDEGVFSRGLGRLLHLSPLSQGEKFRLSPGPRQGRQGNALFESCRCAGYNAARRCLSDFRRAPGRSAMK